MESAQRNNIEIVDPWAPRALGAVVLAPAATDPWLPLAQNAGSVSHAVKTAQVIETDLDLDFLLGNLWEFSATGATGRSPLAAAVTAKEGSDPWLPAELRLRESEPETTRVFADRFGADAPLPAFIRDVREAWFDPAGAARSFEHHPSAKAAQILNAAPPGSSRKRSRLLSQFIDVFETHREPAFFKRIQSMAVACDDLELLLQAISLKDCWEDAPEFWLFRTARSSKILHAESARNGLSWPAAVAIARHRGDFEPADMIDPEWIEEWRALRLRDECYNSFAGYARRRAARRIQNCLQYPDDDREDRIADVGFIHLSERLGRNGSLRPDGRSGFLPYSSETFFQDRPA